MATSFQGIPADLEPVAGGSVQRSCLKILLEASMSAQAANQEAWQFAVEMDYLLAAGATVSLLRRWAATGILVHGVETTKRNARRRTFVRVHHLGFAPGTCFVVTAAGAAALEAVGGGSHQDQPSGKECTRGMLAVPRWDRRSLRLGTMVVKKFRQPAPNQKLVLDTFQELGWIGEVDDPLPRLPGCDPKMRLYETIQSLNRHMQARLIHFGATGTGQGVRWEYAEESPPVAPTSIPNRPSTTRRTRFKV